MKLYSARRHEREISALSEEYGGRLKDLQAALVIWSIKIKTANSKIPQRQEYFTPAGFFSPCPCILFF